ncbi:hypothetical protein D3C85_1044300 [compost metagenome]
MIGSPPSRRLRVMAVAFRLMPSSITVSLWGIRFCQSSWVGATPVSTAWYRAKLMPSRLLRISQVHWSSSLPWSTSYSWSSIRGARHVKACCGCVASRVQTSLVVLLPRDSSNWRSELDR